MTHRGSFWKAFGLGLPLLGALATGACGGSARTEGVLASAAGAMGQASAGGGAGGAANGCETVDCSDVTCRADQVKVHGPCCDTCAAGGGASVGGASAAGGVSAAGSAGALDCDNAICDLACATGESAQPTPGSCCPVCMPESAACVKGQAGFQSLLSNLLEQPGALSCAQDSDCMSLPSFPKCGEPCFFTPVSSAQRDEIAAVLGEWEADSCASCPQIILPCPAPPRPVCVNGQCR